MYVDKGPAPQEHKYTGNIMILQTENLRINLRTTEIRRAL
jgi:hypothetical protein